jgi:hypothetical protein
MTSQIDSRIERSFAGMDPPRKAHQHPFGAQRPDSPFMRRFHLSFTGLSPAPPRSHRTLAERGDRAPDDRFSRSFM